MADAEYDGLGGGFSQSHDSARLTGVVSQRYVNLAGGLVSLALVVGAAVWGYKLAVRDVRGVPVIQALEGPMRIAPTDPGGEIADHQGLAVNDVAAAGIAAPPPERLVLAPQPVDLAEEDAAGLASQPLAGVEEASAPADVLTGNSDLALAATPLTESASPTEVAIDAALAEALGEPVAAPEPGPEPVADALEAPLVEGAITTSIRPRARPGQSAAAPTEAAVLAAPNEVDPATITVGTRLVQFGTFDTAEEARAEWSRLQGQFGELLAEKALVLQPAESGGRVFYRLRAHGFEGEDDARRFCSAFVAQDAVCIPVPHK